MDPLQNLLNQVVNRQTSPFPANSRYHGVEISSKTLENGKKAAYIKRRFILIKDPDANYFTEHTVHEGDRLDNLAANYIGDPEQFWKIADDNLVLRPEELTAQPGSKILISRIDLMNS
jgi:hypothetical protein